MDIKTIAEIINGGGNLALILCAWWIHRAETQLTSIRQTLEAIKEGVKKDG